MQCPYCRTENREDRDTCYHCKKDLSMLRLISHKARTHFNNALELADRSRDEEAVAELHNALDLDHAHAPSHVVLGTLHARLGQMDRAEECWREALAIDPQIEKAHEYLGKLQTVRRSLPIVYRQRLLIVFLTLVLLCFGGLLWKFNVPNPNRDILERTWQLYELGRYGEALESVAKARKAERPDQYVTSTLLVGDIIRAEQGAAVRAARAYLASGDYVEAAKQAQALLARQPAPRVRVGLEKMVNEARAGARRRVGDLLEAFAQRKVDEESIGRALAVYEQVAGDKADAALVRRAGERLGEIRKDRDIEMVLAKCAKEDADPWRCIDELNTLSSRYPDDPRPRQAAEAIAQPLRAAELARFQEKLDAGDLAGAAEALRPLGRILQTTDPEHASARIRELSDRIAEAREARRDEARRKQVGELERRLRKAYEGEDYESAVEAGEVLMALPGLDDTTRVVAAAMLERSNTRLADQRWKWMVARSGDYTDGRIDVETAEKTVRWYPQVSKHLSRSMYPTSRDNLLFFTAMAYRKLGRKDAYRDAMRELVEKYPDSNYMQWVRRYIERDKMNISK